jgi:hypothetical protein
MDSLLSNAQRCARKADTLVRYGQYEEALNQLDKSIVYLNELKSINSRYELIQMLNVQIDAIDRKMRSVAIKRSESLKRQEMEHNQYLSRLSMKNNPNNDTLLIKIDKNDLVDAANSEYLKVDLMHSNDRFVSHRSKRNHNNNSNGIGDDDLDEDSEILNEENFRDDIDEDDDDVDYLVSHLVNDKMSTKTKNNHITSSSSSSSYSSSSNQTATTSTLSYSSSSLSSNNNLNATTSNDLAFQTEPSKSNIVYNAIDLSKYIQEDDDEDDDDEQVFVDLNNKQVRNLNKKNDFNNNNNNNNNEIPPNEFIID